MSKSTKPSNCTNPNRHTSLPVAMAIVGLLLIMVGTLAPVFNMGTFLPTFRYIYAAGAVLLLVGRLFTHHQGASIRLKRLARIEVWSALFFCAGAFFMFYQPGNGRDWLAFTLAGGAIQCYTALMIPREIAKQKENTDN